MAVQAQYPSNVLPDIRNRKTQVLGVDTWSFLGPVSYGSSHLEDHLQPGTSGVINQQRILQSVATPVSGQPVENATLYRQPELDHSTHIPTARKRARESDSLAAQRQQHPTLSLAGDFNHSSTGSPLVHHTGGVVSTGLRLAFDDERVSSTTLASGRGEAASTMLYSLCEDLSGQLVQQKEELEQFLITQGGQFRHALEERRQRHSRALLATIEEGVSRRLKEKELELEKVNRRNTELEERVKHLSLEAHLWQSKAKSNEALVLALRTNLQQAVAQSREQSKEGCGDSEADDAASAHLDENAEAQARALRNARDWRESPRVCRICRTNEVSVLVLPCLHLCLCKACEGPVEHCPLCQYTKSASVEVYLS